MTPHDPVSGRGVDARRERVVEFLGAQDGPAERELKTALCAVLARYPAIDRAYLARVGFGREAPATVALCLASRITNDQHLLAEIEATFRPMFNGGMVLDILFLRQGQEPDLQKVCPQFYPGT